MNIAIVSPYSWAHPGGVNNHIKGLAGQLMQSGHKVTVIAPDGAAKAGDSSYFEVESGRCGVFSAGRSIAIPANGSIANLALIPGAGKRVEKLLRGGGYDVVHVHEPLVPLVSTAAVKAAGCRLVGTFHAAEGREFLYRAAKLKYGRAMGNIDCRIAVSVSAKKVISEFFPGDYRIIPNGVEVKRFNSYIGTLKRKEYQDDRLVLFVGRDEPRKGLPLMLEAFESVAREDKGCRLLLAGSSIEPESVYARVSPELREKVSVLGFVSDEELPEYYAMADVLCAPSLGGESFGIILVEAMAAGTPVVASDIQGYKDVVEATGGGLLFEAGSSKRLSQELQRLLNDRGMRDRLASAGLEGVKRFGWDRVAMEVESCYAG